MKNDRLLWSMTEGLHALVFGVASMKHPRAALNSLEDGGEIHEYVHQMIRLLPKRDCAKNSIVLERAKPKEGT